jgi:ribosomal protein S28E/S33
VTLHWWAVPAATQATGMVSQSVQVQVLRGHTKGNSRSSGLGVVREGNMLCFLEVVREVNMLRVLCV